MNRRSHRKSRLGCRECKRRHIKCDEKRPTCAHCTITQRRCEYVTPSVAATETAVNSPGTTNRSDEAHSPSLVPVATTDERPGTHSKIVLEPHNAHWTNEPVTPSSSSVPSAGVNMNHMEFLLHYQLSIAVPELDDQVDVIATRLVNKLGLEFPWLLHAMLAISARHLAVVRPEKSSFYLSEAFQLQAQAITIFNSQQLLINEANCSAALLFSSILGRHMLVDTLAGLESDGAVLLDHYCRYVQVHRGLRVIASESWQILPETEIWPLILFSGVQRPGKAQGTELKGLHRWVENSHDLDEETIKTCLEAIELLQVGLDKISAARTRVHVCQMAFNWSVRIQADFNDLVMKRLPQALIILAHYTALLHHSRDLWQIGDAGSRFLRTICNVLGPGYDDQLLWVKNLVFGPEP